jgi:predicted DCC family thiol-disulfide oxidoreductase YuxK
MTQLPLSSYRFTAFRMAVGLWFFFLGGSSWFAGHGFSWLMVPTVVAMFASVLVALGLFRRIASLLLLVAWIVLPGFDSQGWTSAGGWAVLLLLPLIFVPAGEPIAFNKREPFELWAVPLPIWQLNRSLGAVAVFLNGTAFMSSPVWRSGTVWRYGLESPIWTPWGHHLISSWADGLGLFFAWGWILLLLVGPLLLWWSRTEKIGFALLLPASLAVLFFYADPCLGVLLLLLLGFGFDGRWLPTRLRKETPNWLLYDGVCALCNRTVTFVMNEDPQGGIRFAALQGETAARLLKGSDAELRSVIYVHQPESSNPIFFRESDAVLKLWEDLGGLWRMLAWFRFVPSSLRNACYQLVARNRYQVFGKYESCPLAPPHARDRFLP